MFSMSYEHKQDDIMKVTSFPWKLLWPVSNQHQPVRLVCDWLSLRCTASLFIFSDGVLDCRPTRNKTKVLKVILSFFDFKTIFGVRLCCPSLHTNCPSCNLPIGHSLQLNGLWIWNELSLSLIVWIKNSPKNFFYPKTILIKQIMVA